MITRQSAILREGGGPTAENVEVNDLFSGRSFGKLKANGESVPNTYSLTSLPTGNEAGESFHHALGFSVAMRFERFDNLYLADATVLENDETEQDDTLHTVSYRLFGIFGLAGYVGEQCGFATGEMVHTCGLLSSSLTGSRSCSLLLFCALSVAVMDIRIVIRRRCFSIVLRIWEFVGVFGYIPETKLATTASISKHTPLFFVRKWGQKQIRAPEKPERG